MSCARALANTCALTTDFPLAVTEVSRGWMIYDVGGSRTSVCSSLASCSYAILLLAPISCFNDFLVEDRRMNLLKDSFLLWNGIVQSKLLAKCIIVCASLSLVSLPLSSLYRTRARTRGAAVFLNKSDLLEKKPTSGTKVNKYFPSFADHSNNAPPLARCKPFPCPDLCARFSH